MKLLLSVALCLLAAVAVTASSEPRHTLGETMPLPMPKGWEFHAPRHVASDAHPVSFYIALKQQNLAALEEKFWAVSDPTNADYGNHLTTEEITALVRPSSETMESVTEWLQAHNVEYTLTGNQDYLRVETTVAKAEKLMNIKYNVYTHTNGARVPAALGPYSVPAHLSQHIDLVSGVVGLPNFNMKVGPVAKKVAASATSYDITPNVLRARYNVTDGNTGAAPGNIQGVAEFQGQYYSPADLCTFFSDYNVTGNCSIARVIGPNKGGREGAEAALDVQYIMGVASDVPTWFYSYASFNFFADLNAWMAELGNETTIPNVISVSYGEQGNYPAFDYQQRADTEYMKIGTRGTSIMYASGDTGAGCQDIEGLYAGSADAVLAPSYPAISPYVTSVGATKFYRNNTGPESAVGPFFKSGGGFSWKHPRPAYQDAAVQGYLAMNASLPPETAYNRSGRATPDVSALGSVHFQIIDGGSVTTIGGTSAASPTFSGIISLLNGVRLSSGGASLGFLNPWLYQSAAKEPTAFFDVVRGNNVVSCGTSEHLGFQCTAGWDPASGLGTPNYEVLKTLL
eukprot:TRINITY_DN900_c0_g1_i1.p1 TRINITY_DN900_c0_g1~~TRINITY_DN900_c0_g1_i1.p1  ORF type:complete len:577 (+),score=180.90 TRINITY_DN900_c0_g1_i1:23-1732(+)